MSERRVGVRAEQKRRWDRENDWRMKKMCPDCQTNLCKKESARCYDCDRPHKIRRIKEAYLEWREHNPEAARAARDRFMGRTA